MAPRLYPAVPETKYLCFYPMDRKRGEQVNWYTVPFAERQRMMHEHGLIGRRYGMPGEADHLRLNRHGRLGVGRGSVRRRSGGLQEADLRDALRRSSAVYALFGQFFIGVRLPMDNLMDWLDGRLR